MLDVDTRDTVMSDMAEPHFAVVTDSTVEVDFTVVAGSMAVADTVGGHR